MEASPPQQGPSKRLCREEDHPIDNNILEQIPPQENHNNLNDLTIENIAFSQYPIIKNIFSFLKPDDLENCWCVSRHWKEVAETFVSVRYDILMNMFPNTEQIILTKRDRFNRRNLKRYKLDLEDATKTLEAALLTHNEKLVLRISNFGLDFDRHDRSMEDFLSKLGPLVQHLCFSPANGVDLSEFCNFLLTNFPNLKTLDGSVRFKKDSTDLEGFNPELPKYQLKQLKKIQFHDGVNSDFETLGKFLKIGPNLEEIIDLPIWCIKAVVIADKAEVLKSVVYSLHDVGVYSKNGLTVVSAFEMLAQLRPKLTFFSLDLHTSRQLEEEEESIIEMVKPSILSILQSSADSLRSFQMCPAAKWGFQNIPQLKGVKTLIFDNFNGLHEKGRFFAAGFSLGETFPTVNKIVLSIKSWEKSINQDLPELMNSSWGSQIKRLKVFQLPLSSLPMVQRLFPLIEELEFSPSANEIPALFRALPKFCPQLKSLTIGIIGERSIEFDCAFSGLSSDVVAQLRDPSQRGYFSDDQIEGFKSQSPILKLTALRRLTLELYFAAPTHVSYEFGFRLLPHLKVSVAHYKI